MTKSFLAGVLALALVGAPALANDHTATVGTLEFSDMRTIETPPNARAGGGFVTIENAGDANRLVSASSPRAARVELHTMTMDGDVMRMREMEGGIELPAGETVELAPGGLHIMFMGLDSPFVAGETVPVTLTFDGGETIDLALPVVPRQMGGSGHSNGSTN